ncbi:MAG: protein of unknown function containing DUF4139 domain [Rhodobacteraceae bacterium HLUCCA12]|nr:MAG: protein of unknown function containing DUF4139 domain [Rhodobacteraceae bacterium HLUCCA12]
MPHLFPLPRRLGPALALALGGVGLALPLYADTSVRAVTLSTAGLAMIEARATLDDSPLHLPVARDDIDDFLKSLWVLDPAGAVAHLTMRGPGGFDDAFDRLALSPDDVTDRARLLTATTGAPIMAERRGERWTGLNMGVSERPCEAGTCRVLNLQAEDGSLRAIALDEALSVTFTDAADRDAVRQALEAWRLRADDRQVTVSLRTDDPSEREAGLVWLQQAPVWRTAWRAVDTDDGLRLVGWAVVENATGQDWDEVQLTLATGATRNIAADLYARRLAAREAGPALEPAPMPAPMARSGALAMMPEIADSAASAETTGDDGDSFTRFTLDQPVTLAAGQIVSLPFLSETLPDARMTLYRGGEGARHPSVALQIENPLPLRLPAGVLTLYEAGRGHAGDTIIPELAPGATETVDFAQDSAVTIREETGTTERLREMRLVRGLLHVTEDLERRTTYRIEGAPQSGRRLTLEHPRRPDWSVTEPNEAEETADAWRWEIDLPAGETVTHTVTERQPRLRRIALMNADLPTLAFWEQRADDPELRETLADLAELNREVEAAETRARRAADEAEALEREQDRLVELIVQLGDDSAANRDRRARVDAIDAEIAAQIQTRRDAEAEIDDLRARIADLLEG